MTIRALVSLAWCCIPVCGAELYCVPAAPSAVTGRSVEVTAWYSGDEQNVRYRWKLLDDGAGVLGAQGGNRIEWTLPGVEPGTYAIAAEALVEGRAVAACQPANLTVEPRGPHHNRATRGPASIAMPAPSFDTQRAFLTRGAQAHPEDEGYGQYSYLLFRVAPANETEKLRYQAFFKAVVRLMNPVSAQAETRAKQQLNVTWIPVRTVPAEDMEDEALAQWLVTNYDYRFAADLLARAGMRGNASVTDGIYIVSVPQPLTREVPARPPLVQNLSRVDGTLATTWINLFINQAAQNRNWSTSETYRFAANLRNLIAIAANGVPDVKGSLGTLIGMFTK